MERAPPTRARAWRWASLAARLLLVSALLVGLFVSVDVQRLGRVASELSPWTVLVMLACGTAARAFGVVRWNVVCGGLLERSPGVPRLFRLGLLAEFVNAWVPSSLGGEVVRVWGVRAVSDTAAATWSVVVDRALGLVGLLLALVPVVLLVELPGPRWLRWLPLVLAGLFILAGLVARPWLTKRGRWGAVLAGLSGRRLLGALVLSVCSPWCLVLAYVVFFDRMGVSVPFATVAAYVLLSRFGRAVPIQVLGLNSVEASMWLLGEVLGLPREVVALSMATNFLDKLVHSMVGGGLEVGLGGTGLLSRVRGDRGADLDAREDEEAR